MDGSAIGGILAVVLGLVIGVARWVFLPFVAPFPHNLIAWGVLIWCIYQGQKAWAGEWRRRQVGPALPDSAEIVTEVSRREGERQAALVAKDRAYQNSDRAKVTGRFARENERVRAFNRRMDAERA
jgi:hypothetical protein